MFESIRAHVIALPIDDSLSAALLQMVEHDIHMLQESPQWIATIPYLGELFGLPHETVETFGSAWCLMYAAMRRLDKLQDSDPIDDLRFAQLPSPMQYHLVISYYVLATSLLDRLSESSIAAYRIQRLRRLWIDSLFRAASGQRNDLAMQSSPDRAIRRFEGYQELVHAKAGPFFALAFGGVAALATDDESTITALAHTGELFGALAQYADDLIDVDESSGQTSVLAEALISMRPDLAEHGPAAAVRFFEQIAQAYLVHATTLLGAVDHSVRQGIIAMFAEAYGYPRIPIAQP